MTGRRSIQSIVASVAILGGLTGPLFAQALKQDKQQVPETVGKVENEPKGPKPVAVVNSSEITKTELEAVLRKAGPKPNATEAQKRQTQMEALALLIDDQLMKEFLAKQGLRVEPAQVDKQVVELVEGLKKQQPPKTLADYLKEQGQTEAQLRADISSWLQWNAFIKDKLKDEDVKNYYEESKDFFDRVLVKVSHIVLRVPPDAPSAEREGAIAKLRVIRKEILDGKIDFAAAAKKYSQCTSAPHGGDIGYIPRKLAVEESFAKAAFALKVGELSDVVPDDFGLHLIKVTERKPGTPTEFTKIKEEVRELCIEELRMAILAKQRKTAKVEINLP